MFKKYSIIFFFILLYLNFSCNGIVENNEDKNCFSKENFNKVYLFIEAQNTKNKAEFFKYDGYEIYLNNTGEISFKKEGISTLSKVYKEKGIFSLEMYKKQHDKLLLEANQLFCKLLSEANN